MALSIQELEKMPLSLYYIVQRYEKYSKPLVVIYQLLNQGRPLLYGKWFVHLPKIRIFYRITQIDWTNDVT